jgi:CheY-like chemotaxis protein/HPt (histidine-containing phosphotransfer) domain-containing protein
MLSSVNRAEETVRARELGISSHLTKPVRRSALLSAITEAVLGSSPAAYEELLPAAEAAWRKPLRVLVAEDNPVNQKLASAILRRAGHFAILVSNGRDAVAAIERERFDAVLMDVQMPVMGGFEATRLIREMETASGVRTPIIAVTARAMKGDREACLEAGMDAFVPKPIQSTTLLETLDRIVMGTNIASSAAVHVGNNEATDGSGTFDEAALLVLVSGDRGLAAELAELFLDDLEPRMTEIKAAVMGSDAERLRAGAHALRGSAATMMAQNVATAAGALEGIGRSGLLDGVQRALEDLNVALAIVRPRLVALTGRT